MPSIGFIKLLLLLLILAYLSLAAFAALFSKRLVFPVPPVGYSDSPDIIKFPYDEQGNAVSMVYLDDPESRFLVFYNHGNGEDLQSALGRIKDLRAAGYAVLAWDYPGYGTSDGKPGERLTLDVARKIWKDIPDRFGYGPEQVVLVGRSLGSGPAVMLAQENKPAGLILEGAFTSIFRVGIGRNILPWDLFDNLSRINSINCPSLFIHGTDDRTVPFMHGVRLFEAAPQPKFFTWIDKGRHNDLVDVYSDTYYSSIRRFTDFISTQ